MNMRGDMTDMNGKSRFKYRRGKVKEHLGADTNLFDFTWGSGKQPKTLIPPIACKCIFCTHPYYRNPDFTKKERSKIA